MFVRPSSGARTVVRVAHHAFVDMVFAAIESAVVPPELTEDSIVRLTQWDRTRKMGRRRRQSVRDGPLPPSLVFSRTGLETTGVLVGRHSLEGNDQHFRVERMFPVTAQRTDHSVGHSETSPELFDGIAAALDLPWEIIGGFHSHPLMDVAVSVIEDERHFGPSAGDLFGPKPFIWKHDIDLIVSVTRAGDEQPTPPMQPGPVMQYRIGDFDLWLAAYRGANDFVVLSVETAPDPSVKRPRKWQRGPASPL